MSNRNETAKSEGVAEQIGGKIKKGVGALIGDDQMRAEGTGELVVLARSTMVQLHAEQDSQE